MKKTSERERREYISLKNVIQQMDEPAQIYLLGYAHGVSREVDKLIHIKPEKK